MAENGVWLLGLDLGFGMNALVGGLVGLHVLALLFWLIKFMQEGSKSTKQAAIKKRQ
uniref:Copper transporter n=1 Tax=Peronospora matthiolae TaxID=2874970 RepID=A0AAV1TGK4_9STRA